LTAISLSDILNFVINLGKIQRKELAKALYDIGKLVLAALVMGQFISGVSFRLNIFAVGLLIFVAAFIIATMLNKGVE